MRILFLSILFTSPAIGAEPAVSWSLRPRAKPAVPTFDDATARAWTSSPIDAFILQRLKREGLQPQPPADRATLLRRVTFDLSGLPPTLKELEDFLNDDSADAFEKQVDRLLATPEYGERWGRHWLDVVRYAETEGFEYDRHRAGAWRYRDYVIRSFNDDVPFDRFVREQVAGDESAPDDHRSLIAAGFHRLGPVRRNAGNQALAFSRDEVLSEMTDILGTALLGMTVGCARCHDHKFDPFSQIDYYRLQAFLAGTSEHDLVLANKQDQEAWEKKTESIQAVIKLLRKKADILANAEKEKVESQILELEQSLPEPLDTISTVRHLEKERTPIFLLKRGNPEKKDQAVAPRLPSAFVSKNEPELAADVAKPKTLLANWITQADHPLTARVIVNRIWRRHFEHGIVDTPNDFGINGSKPSHPELLDWLANDFVDHGWKIKRLHRLIVLSNTYRQASQMRNAEFGMRNEEYAPIYVGPFRSWIPQSAFRIAHSIDPDNRLLGRYPIRRLDAEEVRDAMLTVAGRLNPKKGGPSILLPVDRDLVNQLYSPSQWASTKEPREFDRRTVYLIVKRNLRLPFLETFDQPDGQSSCGSRESSTHALQSLELLNGKMANDFAESFAQRLKKEAGDDPARQVELAYRLAVGRGLSPREKDRAIDFLRKQPLKEFALAVFNLNAFLYVN